MLSLPYKLNAFDISNPEAALNDKLPGGIRELSALIKKAKDNKGEVNSAYRLEREEIIGGGSPCPHCPKYLKLTSEINKVIEKMQKNPATYSDEVPAKLNNLTFLFFTEKRRAENGSIECKRFMDLTPDLKPTKFDGQFKLMADEVLKFNAVTDIQYSNPSTEEIVYYYRGSGYEKDIVVQAILTKEGGRFRYFRYIPSEQETNPYNLPDMGGPVAAKKPSDLKPDLPNPAGDFSGRSYSFNDMEEEKRLQQKAKEESEALAPLTSGAAPAADPSIIPSLGKYGVKLKADVEKKNSFIPKNVHFAEAIVDQDILGDLKVKASSDLSLKGNEAHLALKNGKDDLMVVELQTKLNGKTEHKVTVPFNIKVSDDGIGVKGKAETNNNGQVINMSLTDKGLDFIRSEFRRNGSTGATSYVLARDVALAKNETVSMQLGSGEDRKEYVSVKHIKKIKDNITLVLDVRVDQDKKATLFYQVQAKF
jgi:hypothetical protein